MNRLTNAVSQRDAAREESMLALEKLKKLEEDIDAGHLAPVAAAPSVSAISAPVPMAQHEPGTACLPTFVQLSLKFSIPVPMCLPTN